MAALEEVCEFVFVKVYVHASWWTGCGLHMRWPFKRRCNVLDWMFLQIMLFMIASKPVLKSDTD